MTFSRNATSAHKQLATATFNIPQRESLGKYLGCLVSQGRPSISTFEEIITKATKKLEDWKANILVQSWQNYVDTISPGIITSSYDAIFLST